MQAVAPPRAYRRPGFRLAPICAKDRQEEEPVSSVTRTADAFRPQRRRNRGRAFGRCAPPRRTRLGSRRWVLYMYCKQVEIDMLALRLPAEIEKRLDALARKTGRSKSFYAREAILRHLEDLEDYHLARRRLARKAKRVSLEDLERELAETG
jgi:RHH-type rel operon transcriptional repressor/antitoxin RelB